MIEVRIPDDLWDTAKVPEGIVANWFYADGSQITAGATIAELMVEKTTFDIKAPAAGILSIAVKKDGVVKPGSVIAQIG
jgi:pyruvate/2-oxoglutarate dehydrogenase complex dihydrolipoamide acyltransferase (E2) component